LTAIVHKGTLNIAQIQQFHTFPSWTAAEITEAVSSASRSLRCRSGAASQHDMALPVVEMHGCESVTVRRAVVLGRTVGNVASATNGGIGFDFDEDGEATGSKASSCPKRPESQAPLKASMERVFTTITCGNQ
jgi:hypothetical protein